MNTTFFKKNNLIGQILKITGLVVIGWEIIWGLIISVEFNDITLSVFFTPIVYGILIIGFGEVIELLQEIADKGKPKREKVIEESTFVAEVPFTVEHEIKGFYSNKNMEVDTIKPMKDRDVFAVGIEGRTEYVKLGGVSPKILSEEEAEKYM